MARNKRQSKIIEIITSLEIETQEELCNELNQEGFNITQATISRDIKELGLFKVHGKQKKYKYAFVENESAISAKVINLFKHCVISIKYANNLVVIKTLSGNGSNAGMCVDKFNLDEVIGSVAGDDTLLVIAKTNDDAVKITETLQDILNN